MNEIEISDGTLELLQCPVTHSRLTLATAEILASINQKIQAGELVDAANESVSISIEKGLVNEDRTVLYPIRDGIIVLTSEKAISITTIQ